MQLHELQEEPMNANNFYYERQSEKRAESDKEHCQYYINVDGEQVFTASFVWEQMMAQSCRIDRARRVAVASLIIALIAVITLGAVALCK